MPRSPSSRPRSAPWLGPLLLALGLAAVGLFVRQLDPVLAGGVSPLVLTLNLLPWCLLGVVLALLGGRPLAACVLTGSVAAALLVISAIKMRQLQLPVLPSDFEVLGQVFGHWSLFSRYLQYDWRWLLVLLLPLLFWLEPRTLPGGRRRWALALPPLLLVASLLLGGWPWTGLYAFDAKKTRAWLPSDGVKRTGTTAYFIGLALQRDALDDQPDPQALAGVAQRFPELADPVATDSTRPDIIVLQSESLFDPACLRGLDGRDWLPNWHRLQASGSHGQLQVPTFGGLTTRTEFETLTGIPLAGLGAVQYPFLNVVHGPLQSLAWQLKRHGYATRAVHPYERAFYRRGSVYPLLGFDSFHADNEFADADRHGYFIADQALARRVRELLDAGHPQLVFAISMENHGPWNAGRGLDPAELATIDVPPGLADDDALALREYLHHLARIDAAIGELGDWVMARPRPTLLLVYGDHLPGLHGTFASLGFVDGRSGPEQTVPWLLLDNRAADGRDAGELHSYDLAARLLQQAGLDDDRFFRAERLLADRRRVADAEAWPMLEALSRARLGEPVEQQVATLADGEIVAGATLEPRTLDADPAPGQPPIKLWLRSDDRLPRDGYLELAGRRVRSQRLNAHLLVAELDADLRADLFTRPAELPLALVAPVAGRRQPLGMLSLQPPPERARLADGRAATALCPVSQWGPSQSRVGAPENVQPNGEIGFWMRTPCLPRRLQLAIGDTTVEMTREHQLATALVPRTIGDTPGRYPLSVIDPDAGERLELGSLQIDP